MGCPIRTEWDKLEIRKSRKERFINWLKELKEGKTGNRIIKVEKHLKFTECVDKWQKLSDKKKQYWKKQTIGKPMSGYCLYINHCMKCKRPDGRDIQKSFIKPQLPTREKTIFECMEERKRLEEKIKCEDDKLERIIHVPDVIGHGLGVQTFKYKYVGDEKMIRDRKNFPEGIYTGEQMQEAYFNGFTEAKKLYDPEKGNVKNLVCWLQGAVESRELETRFNSLSGNYKEREGYLKALKDVREHLKDKGFINEYEE